MMDEQAVSDRDLVEDRPVGKNRARLVFPWYYRSSRRGVIGILSICVITSRFPQDMKCASIRLGDVEHKMFFKGISCRRGHLHIGVLKIEAGKGELEQKSIHSKVRLSFDNAQHPFTRPFTFNVFLRNYVAAHGPYLDMGESGTVAFFRQNVGRGVTLTVRHKNVTDGLVARVKLAVAYWMSRLPFFGESPIIVFEKNAAKYGESGRTVYERLIDKDCPNVRFVISREVSSRLDVPERYRSCFLAAHSFSHYLAFFRSKTFIGTEALAHALELRVQHRRVQEKLKDRNNRYVFLQHGVMYMVSLDSPQRSSFRRKMMPDYSKVVVSSEREANHFTELADFTNSDLIVCGLPKFDTSYMDSAADKIVIMPTWRIWEFNIVRSEPEKSGYYQMVQAILESIPDRLKRKVVMVPHPLFDASTFGAKPTHEDLDVLLRDACMLITDYSSIAYDAFYRGANVVFWWADLEECMEHYGEPTHLMIDEGSAFGPVCRTGVELSRWVEELYGAPQRQEFVERYREIVTFHDGHNTDRLIEKLVEDGVVRLPK